MWQQVYAFVVDILFGLPNCWVADVVESGVTHHVLKTTLWIFDTGMSDAFVAFIAYVAHLIIQKMV